MHEEIQRAPLRYEWVCSDHMIARAPLLSPEQCATIQELANTHATKAGGWSRDHPSTYEQSTVDIEVDKAKALRRYLREIDLIPRVQRLYWLLYRRQVLAFDDCFVVKYERDGLCKQLQSGLRPHTDAGNLSFMIALSQPGRDYIGGGTHFLPPVDKFVHCDQGSILIFPAHLMHEGVTITHGCRFLLVAFCFTEDCNEALRPGNVSLSLRSIPQHKPDDREAPGQHAHRKQALATNEWPQGQKRTRF